MIQLSRDQAIAVDALAATTREVIGFLDEIGRGEDAREAFQRHLEEAERRLEVAELEAVYANSAD